jgi:hypothetical protein
VPLQAGVEAVKDILEAGEHDLQPNMICISFTSARNESYLIYKVSHIPLQSLTAGVEAVKDILEPAEIFFSQRLVCYTFRVSANAIPCLASLAGITDVLQPHGRGFQPKNAPMHLQLS